LKIFSISAFCLPSVYKNPSLCQSPKFLLRKKFISGKEKIFRRGGNQNIQMASDLKIEEEMNGLT